MRDVSDRGPPISCFKLNRVDAQLSSYVEDAVRRPSLASSWTTSSPLEKSWESRQDSTRPRMLEYGYAILDTLVLGIQPEPRVKASMNEIEMQNG